MVGLTRSWASELGGDDGIRVNLVAPGFIPVERHADASEDDLEAYRRHVQLGHQGVPEDIAGTVRLPRLAGRRLHHLARRSRSMAAARAAC